MTVRWMDRLGRLVRADAHGVLEALEDRSLLLKQHLREAELDLQRKRSRVEALAEEERRLGEDARRLEESQHALDADAQLALSEQREELARFAIRRLLPLRREADALRLRAAERAYERARLEARLGHQEQAFEALAARVRAQLAECARPATPAEVAGPPVADEEVEMELLRRRQSPGGAS